MINEESNIDISMNYDELVILRDMYPLFHSKSVPYILHTLSNSNKIKAGKIVEGIIISSDLLKKDEFSEKSLKKNLSASKMQTLLKYNIVEIPEEKRGYNYQLTKLGRDFVYQLKQLIEIFGRTHPINQNKNSYLLTWDFYYEDNVDYPKLKDFTYIQSEWTILCKEKQSGGRKKVELSLYYKPILKDASSAKLMIDTWEDSLANKMQIKLIQILISESKMDQNFLAKLLSEVNKKWKTTSNIKVKSR